MTEPNDSTTSTRPISVAELLARNGTIGAPAPGGRRRRRRGNADAVTVAELTGEIPIVTAPVLDEAGEVDQVDEAPAAAPEEPETEPEPAPEADLIEPEPEAEPDSEPESEPEPEPEALEVDGAEAEYTAHLQQREDDPAPLAFDPRARRTHGLRRSSGLPAGGAEEMSPDPLIDEELAESDNGTAEESGGDPTRALPSYLRSSTDTLFGGDTVADDLARRTRTPGPEDIDLGGSDEAPHPDDEAAELGDTEPKPASPFLRGVWIVLQSVFAVAFGAGLFVAFDQLWKWNNIVALVLSVLVILGLVVGVRVVRRTEDIASTLIAVAVGAMVTLGPLALLQST